MREWIVKGCEIEYGIVGRESERQLASGGSGG